MYIIMIIKNECGRAIIETDILSADVNFKIHIVILNENPITDINVIESNF